MRLIGEDMLWKVAGETFFKGILAGERCLIDGPIHFIEVDEIMGSEIHQCLFQEPQHFMIDGAFGRGGEGGA
jgi:hypothetical protein